MVDLLEAASSSKGAYGITEAARYLSMPAGTLRGWFLGVRGQKPVHRAGIVEGDVFLLTFDDFVEAAAVRCLRFDHKISLQTIRAAYTKALNDYGIERFFNRRTHKILASSNRELLICVENEDPQNPVNLTGTASDQREFHALAQAYLKQVEWDEEGLAKQWVAYRFGGTKIVMAPGAAFGEPILEKSGYRVETVYNAFMADADTRSVADNYGLEEEEVEAVCAFMSSLSPAA